MSDDHLGLSPAARKAIGNMSKAVKYLMLCERVDGLTEAHAILLEHAKTLSRPACTSISNLIADRITELNDERMALLAPAISSGEAP